MNSPAAQTPATRSTTSVPVPRPLDPRAVTAVLTAIRTDSQRQPETFLKDTAVPHGGE